MRYNFVFIVFLCLFGVGSFLYSGFTADDAYITARYAYNLAHGHGLIYNVGEQVSALTSPLHALFLACLFLLSSEPVVLYKWVAAVLVAATLFKVSGLFKDRATRYAFLALTLLSPFVMMWTQGGLETPLLLVVITLITWLVLTEKNPYLIVLLAALAFLIRFDAVLFLLPIVGYLLYTRRIPLTALLLGVIPAGWLVFSYVYYGDLLPTSFYVKGPILSIKEFLSGLLYEEAWFCLSGLAIPCILFRKKALSRIEMAIGLGLALTFFYGLTAGIKHMMFGYRFYLPFLPSILLVLLPRTQIRLPHVACIGLLQLIVFVCMYYGSVNPSFGEREYARLSVRDYGALFLPAMDANGEAIQKHWKTVGKKRPMRVYSYAAGRMPYYFPDTYMFEGLVSYRKHCHFNWKMSSDYIQVFTPELGTRELQLRGLKAKLIDRQSIDFNGGLQHFEVWYNPNAGQRTLPPRINDACAS